MTTESSKEVQVSATARLHLLHGYMQLIAEANNVDILHLKGAAIHPELNRTPRGSVDVDVLVRPDHVDRFIEALHLGGWETVTGFEEGSAFGHAMNLRHRLGLVDVHRNWPGFGIPAADAFDTLWQRRAQQVIAEIPCAVPSLQDQRLILLLHYGRSGGQRTQDFQSVWGDAKEFEREQLRKLARTFDASMALGVAVGEAADYTSDPAYPLWRYFAAGEGRRLDEWQGRWRAAQGSRNKGKVIISFLMVNRGLLRADLGRAPTRKDYAQAYQTRIARAWAEVMPAIRQSARRRDQR